MHSIESSYSMEIVHIDFLVIGSKKDPNKKINVLVVTDHFTRYTQAFVTMSETVHTVAVTLYEKYLAIMVGLRNYTVTRLEILGISKVI